MTTLYVELDRNSNIALHKQLILKLKDQILCASIAANAKLPSSRVLAKDLGVSRIVTIAAYEQLIAEGYLTSRAGSGTFTSASIPEKPKTNNKDYVGPSWFNAETKKKTCIYDHEIKVKYDFSIGHPATKLLPRNSWNRAWRKALSRSFSGERPDRAGIVSIREALTGHLERSRNIFCHPDNIIITSGVAETLRLLSKVMTKFEPEIFMESPGFNVAHHWLAGCGKVTAINVDERGLIASELPMSALGPTMLFCTPSHQFPLGFRLNLKRRGEILKWARNNDALILEDDYDSEFHYDSMPLPTLKSQDESGHVVYFSSFSKSVSPNIKVGYLIAPDNICAVLKNIIAQEHAEPPFLMQEAMAHFIESGDLDKHIARSRRHYAKLNKIMREKLSDLPTGVTVSGLESGIHAFISFKEFPTALIKKLEEKSFHLPHQISENDWKGFALGYGHFEEDQLSEALELLKSVLNTEL